MSEIRIVLVDDDQSQLNTLHEQLSRDPMFKVVGEATSGQGAIKLVAQLVPDVILMDVKIEEHSGIEPARQIILNSPQIRIIMLTIVEDIATKFSAIRAGVKGYLPKGIEVERLLRAVHSVYDGESIFGSDTARQMIAFFDQNRPLQAKDTFPQLTKQEAEVLGAMVAGLNYQETAEKMNISIKKVRNMISNILNKLQVIDRSHAIELAIQAGWSQKP